MFLLFLCPPASALGHLRWHCVPNLPHWRRSLCQSKWGSRTGARPVWSESGVEGDDRVQPQPVDVPCGSGSGGCGLPFQYFGECRCKNLKIVKGEKNLLETRVELRQKFLLLLLYTGLRSTEFCCQEAEKRGEELSFHALHAFPSLWSPGFPGLRLR